MASQDGTSVQTVKLKVLYTFDADQKENHLARWPQALDVNTCFVDSVNQIGVVDLRTCLEAVNNASPELSSRPDTDFAIYAYDYSEEDTPLVGQGMLSKQLLGQDDQDSEAMVTGRIAKGMMALLSKNAQPTLEVKLRLKPVSTFMSQRTRSGSISSQDGRTSQWIQNSERPGSPMDTSGLESMQRMLSEGGPPRERAGSIAPDAYGQSRSISRPGTPTLVPSFNPPQRQTGESSRPSSRAGTRKPSQARRDSFNSGYYSGEEDADEGPTRKRAKISKVDWPSKTNLNIEKQPDSLRVAASTASSVRLHRPIAMKPATLPPNGVQLEEPVRPPTPIPTTKSGKPRGRPRLAASSLQLQSSLSKEFDPALRLAPHDTAETAVSSPEESRARSISSTPANIPSSPPVMLDQHGPLITSPALPPMMPGNTDSGFMSGNLDDLFIDDQMIRFDDYLVDKPDEQQNMVMYDQATFQPEDKEFVPVFDDGNESNEQLTETEQEQSTQLALPPPARPMSRSQSFAPGNRVGMSSPKLAPAPFPRARQIEEENQRSKKRLPPVPASDPVGRTLQRSNTWAGERGDALMSDAPTVGKSRPKTNKKVGKDQTQARLEKAIADGEAPPFCDNCGTIETPAWRRGYAKDFDCEETPWADVDMALSYGAVVFKEKREYSEEGSLKTFRGYKTEKLPGDDAEGWYQITLCNPCGLWFHKQKCPRPKEKWEKKNPKEKGKRKRAPKNAKPPPKKAAVNTKSDAPTPASDDSSPADTATEAPDGNDNDNDNDYDVNTGDDENTDANEPQLPPIPRDLRANSAEPVARGLRYAHHKHSQPERRIRSSPGQTRGSETEPIEVDLTPKPLRRQLFPSSNKTYVRADPPLIAQHVTIPTTQIPSFVRRSPRLNKTKDVFQIPGVAGAVAITADGKENMIADDNTLLTDEMRELFTIPGDMPDEIQLPTTPTPKRRSDRLSAKTPQRQFGLEMSPNPQRSPSVRTPKLKQHPVAHALLGTVKKNVADMTPFTRSIQEMLDGKFDEAFRVTPNSRRSSKKTTPNKNVNFDFPDLPSLKNSSPMAGDQIFAFNLSELTTDQLQTDIDNIFSTDAQMPSSPPGFYSFINEDAHLSNDWITATPKKPTDQQQDSCYPDPEEMSLAPMAPPVLRRSPRKSKS